MSYEFLNFLKYNYKNTPFITISLQGDNSFLYDCIFSTIKLNKTRIIIVNESRKKEKVVINSFYENFVLTIIIKVFHDKSFCSADGALIHVILMSPADPSDVDSGHSCSPGLTPDDP